MEQITYLRLLSLNIIRATSSSDHEMYPRELLICSLLYQNCSLEHFRHWRSLQFRAWLLMGKVLKLDIIASCDVIMEATNVVVILSVVPIYFFQFDCDSSYQLLLRLKTVINILILFHSLPIWLRQLIPLKRSPCIVLAVNKYWLEMNDSLVLWSNSLTWPYLLLPRSVSPYPPIDEMNGWVSTVLL